MSSLSALTISPSRFHQARLFLPPPANPRSSPPHLRIHLRPSSPRRWSVLRHASGASPPSPEPDDPFGDDPTKGLETTFFRIQDGVQIFFSVLFWMSVFFWACTMDGMNNSRPRKGSR